MNGSKEANICQTTVLLKHKDWLHSNDNIKNFIYVALFKLKHKVPSRLKDLQKKKRNPYKPPCMTYKN